MTAPIFTFEGVKVLREGKLIAEARSADHAIFIASVLEAAQSTGVVELSAENARLTRKKNKLMSELRALVNTGVPQGFVTVKKSALLSMKEQLESCQEDPRLPDDVRRKMNALANHTSNLLRDSGC